MTALIVIGILFAVAGFVGAMANQIAGLGLIGIAGLFFMAARIVQASTTTSPNNAAK